LRRLMKGADATKSATRSYTSPWDMTSAKATLSGIETIRTIKRGNIHHKQPGVRGEIKFISQLFAEA
ncbi:hypothetical protein ACGYJ8_20260, partial [Sulfitobacter sp. 1A12126]